MKTKLGVILAGASLLGSSFALGEVIVEGELAYVSKYVFRGLQQSRDAVQAGAALDFNPIYLGVWGNIPVRDSSDSEEINLYAGWRQPLTERLTADFGATFYWYGNEPMNTRRSQEVFAGLRFNFLEDAVRTLDGKTTFYYDVRREKLTAEAAILFSQQLESLPVLVTLGAFFGLVDARDLFPDSGNRVKESYHYTGYSLEGTYMIDSRTQIRLGVAYGDVGNYIPGTQDLQGNWWYRAAFHIFF